MTGKVVDLGPEVGLVWSQKFPENLMRQRARHPFLPDLQAITEDLWAFGPRQPLAGRVERGRDGRDDFLKVYVDDRYALMLFPTRDGRGYWVGGIHPLHFDDHDQVARGALLLRAGGWRVHAHPRELRHLSGWSAVQAAWNAGITGSHEPRQDLPDTHARYLDRLTTLIEQGRRIEATGGAGRLSTYRRVAPVAAVRRSARSVHAFHLLDAGRLTTGSRVHIDGEPDLRGRVEQIDEGVARVRFERPVDFDRIPEVGSFAESPNLLAYDKRSEAVEILRERRSHNPALLPALVDGVYRPFRPAVGTRPAEPLDPSQLSAFHKALEVPDLALIQGPPGTGKTRTIRQLALACAEEDRKVLITSYTNRAVDNVLKDLPDDLLVLRIGREDGVTADCEHLMLEARASELQRHIVERTEPHFRRYAAADTAGGAADALFRQFAYDRERLVEAVEDVRRRAAAVATKDGEVTFDLRHRLGTLDQATWQHQAMLAERVEVLQRLERSLARARRRAEMPLIGLFVRRRVARIDGEAAHARAEADGIHRTLAAIDNDRKGLLAELARVRGTHPELNALRRDHQQALTEQGARADQAAGVAGALRDLLDGPLPPIAADPAALAVFHEAAEQALVLARRRWELLKSWRERLGRRNEQLYGELIRYADVIGATCIGSATSEHLDDVGFDLAIVDEAGQIATVDALVPLVRARRAVMVGDHVQLPPLPDQELLTWAAAEHPDDPDLARLVTHSAFELAFPTVPPGHRELLRYQRRMPEMVARFVSEQFYGGFLETAVERTHRDDLFAAPLAFVDTSALPQKERRGRRPRPDEPWPKRSWLNDREAELAARLAAHYHARSGDWAVILPYSAQIGLVSELLAKEIGDQDAIARRVATVDSFQGGEHDTIIFGFTVSNPSGHIGFLREVRRSNVAFSRARQRLILIGDLSTLLNTGDPLFRGMVDNLHEHVRRRGDLRAYRDVMGVLGEDT
ncbi:MULTISPECIES: DEAD/DEAH box helicase [Actinomadura]|uniref:DEAD/DEAH box helicase n=1 Tax=Actinomadura yumaensis TaxID=111807 RepID=A0ABW2CLE3_9ACTN|nr:AAA domain-containing protein [Actinomadura sp. J1-007]MWK37120.1 AAA family ATPase [Actinomadura sp. J1-007]